MRSSKNQRNEETCPICLDPFTKKTPALQLKCTHSMHLCCVRKYINRSMRVPCPLCRGKIELNEAIHNDVIENINCILKHRKCRGKTLKEKMCRNRSYPGNFGYCRVHRDSNFDTEDIQFLSSLLTKEFQLNFHSKVALYDLFFAARNTYGDRYKGGKEFYQDYQACVKNASHYKEIYERFGLPYPGDQYFLNMAQHLFDCSDLKE